MIDDEPPLLPARVGPFRLGDVIGEGGMGVVVRGTADDGRVVAVKLLHWLPLRRKSDIARFEREARIRVDSANVAAPLEAGVSDGVPWIAFELLTGETLAERLERGVLEARDVVSIGIQAARGLEAAHAAAVIHRDLKPSNLFLCTDGTVKIIDFGIARLDDESTRLTRTGHVLGTPTYLSPEQATGARDLDHRTDLWALGCSLYEALVGRAPFDRATALATMLAVMVEQPAPVASVAPHVPPELGAVIERCLRKKAVERHADARSFRAALESLGEVGGAPGKGAQPTVSVPALPMTTPSISPGEQRVVAVVLAEELLDEDALRDAVETAGGAWLLVSPHRGIGLFGAEAWEGDEVERAASAALDARHAARWIALASGRAAYSGATGIAGNALSAAEAGLSVRSAGVVLDAGSARALSDRWSMQELGDGLFEIVERVSLVSGTLAPPASTTTVGREAEIAQLASVMRAVEEEKRAVTVVVTGAPGAGKSHIRWVLERLLAERGGFRVVSARPEPGERRESFSLFRALMLARVAYGADHLGWPSVRASADAEQRVEAVRRLLEEACADPGGVAERLPFVAELLRVPGASSAATDAARRDPTLMHDRMRLAIEDWLAGLGERGPLAVLLEDLQWADDASLDLVEELVLHPIGVPMLLFWTGRPEVLERRPTLLSPGQVVHIQPRALTTSEVGRLAASILGRELGPDAVRALADRTAGNPLFVEQIALSMREGGARAEERIESIDLPLDVETAVQSRLDHLPSAEKDLCKRAALFGRPFTADELVAAGSPDPARLLSSLMRRDILAGQRGTAGREYRFRSTLVRDVAYRMIAEGLREEMHGRVADVLAAREDADAEETALHLERAGRLREATAQYERGAALASRRGDAPSVLRCVDRALALVSEPPSSYALHAMRAEALELLGRLAEQDVALSNALRAATTDGERARVLTDRAVWLSRHGRREEAIETANRAVAAARTVDDVEALALARGRQAAILTFAGRLDAAAQACDEASSLAESRVPRLAPLAAVWRGQLVGAQGDHGARCEAYRRAVELYQRGGDLRRAAGAEMNLADAYNRFGAYAEAEQALRAALDACRRLGIRLMEGYALANLGYSLTMLGRPGDALVVLDEAATLAHTVGETRLGLSARMYRARALALHGDAEAARTEASLVEREAAELGERSLEALALALRGTVRLAQGDPAEALALTARALAIRDELGSVEEDEAEIFLAHARALEAAGRGGDAQAVRARARARIAEIAARITDPDLRRRFHEDIPTHRALAERNH